VPISHALVTLGRVSGGARIIEYEIVDWDELAKMGDLPILLGETMRAGSPVGILRCVTTRRRKATFAGDAAAARKLIASGAASNPRGVLISKQEFPVMLVGWPYRLRD
jgi:hypothetical protein